MKETGGFRKVSTVHKLFFNEIIFNQHPFGPIFPSNIDFLVFVIPVTVIPSFLPLRQTKSNGLWFNESLVSVNLPMGDSVLPNASKMNRMNLLLVKGVRLRVSTFFERAKFLCAV